MKSQKGAHFLTECSVPAEVFTPEDFSPEHQMIRNLAGRFIENDVVPQQDSLERQEWTTTTALLKRCAEIGLLGIEVPEKYGGENLDKISAMIVAEQFARVASFGVSHGGQAGLGTFPFVFFGTPELKQKYLPQLCRGEIFAAYALSEAGSGSDALAAKTTATASADGRHWILKGEKMWITNAAFADIFITFAQVDGRHFSCFIVEKKFQGVSIGPEEKKMGLKGSSTCPLVLDSAVVPVENVVGEIGKGHHIAFNALNIGRAKLGAIAVGAGKAALSAAVRYAKERIAFGRPIASMGAIKHKIAEMAIRTWVVEAMVYRTAGMIDDAIARAHKTDSSPLPAIREYAVECSILKVFGSEALDFVVDEAVQIHGGYGYSADYAVERYYRDARVNRIFEGTNEINRLLISGLLLKAGVEAPTHETPEASAQDFQSEMEILAGAKDTFHFVASMANEAFGNLIKEQQELLMHISDIAIEIYAMESALLRARKYPSEVHNWIGRTFVNDSISRIITSACNSVAAFTEGDSLRSHVSEIRRRLEWTPINAVQARQRISGDVLEDRLWA
jgi:alkylation response protein AidB-like acyl-CoA dehydrogenase